MTSQTSVEPMWVLAGASPINRIILFCVQCSLDLYFLVRLENDAIQNVEILF